MKVRFIPWFLFVLCTQFVTILGIENFPTSNIEDFNLAKPRFVGKLHVRETNLNVSKGLYEETGRRELKVKQEIVDSVKGQKGRGTHGGRNPGHHPHSNKGEAFSSASPCYLISAAVLHVSFVLVGLLLDFIC